MRYSSAAMDDDLDPHALERSRRRLAYAIRPIRKEDNVAVARLIRTVMPEFGASGPGFAILDPEVDDMFSSYGSHGARAAYFVVAHEGGDIVGGGGFAPLAGGDEGTCELRKMYFLAGVRGLGFGRDLLDACLAGARKAGFNQMYLETLSAMAKARELYERNGFRKLEASLGNTGHYGCNAHYLRDLA
jgi:putative acetyltransferase